MAFSRRPTSLGFTRAFTNLLSSKSFNNYNNTRTDMAMEPDYVNEQLFGANEFPLSSKKRDKFFSKRTGKLFKGDAKSEAEVIQRRGLTRRHFKHPLVSIASIISLYQPYHSSNDFYITDPPIAGSVGIYGIHWTAVNCIQVVNHNLNFGETTPLPSLYDPESAKLVFSPTENKASPEFPPDLTTGHHPRKRGSSSPRARSAGKSNLEGMDGVSLGAATCLLATRRPQRSPSYNSNVDPTVLAKAKSIAEDAIKKNKVFAVLGPYRHIREGMRKRGWVEKFYRAPLSMPPERASSQLSDRFAQNSDGGTGDIDYVRDQHDDLPPAANGRRLLPWEERNGFYGLLGRNVKHVAPNFIWSLKKAHIDFRYLRPHQLVNHHTKAPFTTKVGLCRLLRHYSLYSDKTAEHLFPRCFIVSTEEERARFIREFRLTACMSLLKWVCNYYSIPPRYTGTKIDPEAPVKPAGNKGKSSQVKEYITLTKAVSMALLACDHNLRLRKRDEAAAASRPLNFTDPQWESFLICFYATYGCSTPYKKDDEIYRRSRKLCDAMKINCPQFDLDGQRNIWIVKPGCKSRGRGISCHGNLDIILNQTSSGSSCDNKFVVQKYIERPLLIYNTKFDIRQWFLIADWQPLTIWWYKECYLRFCSREFTLDNFRKFISRTTR